MENREIPYESRDDGSKRHTKTRDGLVGKETEKSQKSSSRSRAFQNEKSACLLFTESISRRVELNSSR